VLRELAADSSLRPLVASTLATYFKDKNAVRLSALKCVANITLDDREPGNHTLVSPRTMRAMGPSWL
jgi:hypothetical protein